MSKDHPFRLAKPRKKGLLRILFGRLPLTLILIVVQVLILVSVFTWASGYFKHWEILQSIFTVVMVLYLYNCDMDSSGKLTWMLMIALFPVPGSLLLGFSKSSLGHRVQQARISQRIQESEGAISQDPAVLAELEADGGGTDDLHRYVNLTGCFPIYTDTCVTYFPNGESKFAALIPELKKAEHFIFLEYFIIEEGHMWGEILEILKEKAEAGVDVRVMYDGTCEISELPSDYARRLAAVGIPCKVFSPLVPILSTHHNYRDHRKILVIDGQVAFTGGVNLADEYINEVKRFGYWKDTAIMLKGPAVDSFTLMFLQMWSHDEEAFSYKDFLRGGKMAPVGASATTAVMSSSRPGTRLTPFSHQSQGFVMPYGDSPLDDQRVGESVYIDMLYRATDYVHIMTPYLILDGELMAALKFAAERGVDVRIILPGIPDKKMAYSLAKSHYKTLLAAGVKIYEFKPGFVHAKVFVSDDKKAVVGTINLDYRSLYHHFECAAYLYRTPCIADIEQDFQDTLAQCREATPETVKNENLFYRVMGWLLKLLAPLM